MGDMKRCVILGAAPFDKADALRPLLRAEDVCIVADGGVRLAAALGVAPTLTVSDCDSAPAPTGEFVHLPVRKDETDTRAAMDIAFERGFREFLLLGCLGGRFDHTVANLLSARQMTEKGCRVVLADEKNEITVLTPGSYPLADAGDRKISFFAMTPAVSGLCLRGLSYPLSNYTLLSDDPLCVSNALADKTATVSFTEGTLLMIFSKD